jgi:hypothetical protein
VSADRLRLTGDRLRVRGEVRTALAPTSVPEVLTDVAAAVTAPIATVEVRHGDARGEGWLHGWCSATSAVVALAADEEGWRDLVVQPALALPGVLARLLGLGPRRTTPDRGVRGMTHDELSTAVGDGTLTSRWTVAVDRPPGPPGSASVVDSEDGYWRVELDAAALRLVPVTPSEVWDDLAAACALEVRSGGAAPRP